jgi:glycosyltransferase involved in cell wall biosynthesis
MTASLPHNSPAEAIRRPPAPRGQEGASPDGRPIRVCYVVGTLGRGGAERQLVYMLRALESQAVQTRVLSLTEGEPFQREIEDLGVPVKWVGANPSRAARLSAIVASLRQEPADVVQSTHFYANLYAAVAASLTGTRSIGAIRGDGLEALRANPLFGMADLFLPDYLAVNSPPAQRYAVEKGRSSARVLLVKNVVDTSRFRATEDGGAERASESLRLLFVGRLTGEKRADRFLRLVERTCREFPGKHVEARLAGDGPDRPALEHLRSTLRLDPERMQFMGEIEDIAPLYSWADMLVLTSDHEGSPNVLLEAMACGLPVVATAVGGIPDLLCRGGGLIVRPESEDSLFDAVTRLANDARLANRLATQGARYIANNHSLDSLGAQLNTMYETVLGAHRLRRAVP